MKVQESIVQFEATIYSLGGLLLFRLPEEESAKLPSRGQVCVTGVINGHDFRTVLEPDGYWGHWMRIDVNLQRELGLKYGDIVTVEVVPSKEWPEPQIPSDFQNALNEANDIEPVWKTITPMARWEWVRWINATNNSQTRTRRVAASISKMRSGKRRPCCFNLAACTDPDVSRSGRLIEPTISV